MPDSRIALGEWVPDANSFGGEQIAGGVVNLRDANGLYPAQNGYRPVRRFGGPVLGNLPLTLISEDQRVLNAKAFRGTDGAAEIFAATPTTLLKFDAATDQFASVSKIATNYNASNSEPWQYAQKGNRLIWVNIADNPQYFDIGTSTEFDDLPGDPPRARTIAFIGPNDEFAILGGLQGDESTVQWAAQNTTETWTLTPDINLSGSQTLNPDNGSVQKIIGGEYATVFQRDAIVRATFTGGDFIFQFDEVVSSIGVRAAQSVVRVGGVIYFYAENGFYAFDGVRAEPIAANKWTRWVENRVDNLSINQMRGTVDRRRNLIVWTWPYAGSLGEFEGQLVEVYFNYQTGEIGYRDVSTAKYIVFEGASQGVFLDDLNEAVDTFSENLDDPIFDASFDVQMALTSETQSDQFITLEDNTGFLMTESGSNLELEDSALQPWLLYEQSGEVSPIRIETLKMALSPGRRSLLTGGFVIGNMAADFTVQMGAFAEDGFPTLALANADQQGPFDYNTFADGFFPLDVAGRYISAEVVITGIGSVDAGDIDDLPVVQGLELQYQPLGRF